MAAGILTLYDCAAVDIGTMHNFLAHTFKASLVTSAYTFSESHALYADITNELPTANGYTLGGGTLTAVTYGRTANVAKFNSDNFVWTATGGNITARRLIVYNDSAAGKPLLGSYLLDSTPADLTATSGNNFTVGPHPTDGWFLHTVN